MTPDKRETVAVPSPHSLTARWRRMDAGVQRVRDSVNSGDPYECPDAVAGALDALYDIWEVWHKTAGLKTNDQNDCARGDAAGEMAAALVFARGSKTHAFVEHGDLTDTFTDTFYDVFGCWRWPELPDTSDLKYAARSEWYAARVARREVLPPLVAAVAWLRGRPELIDVPVDLPVGPVPDGHRE